MRVRFRQSGGVAGVVRGCELDSASLPPDEARELESLVRASGLAASHGRRSSGGRDLRSYEIIVESDDGRVEFTFDDATLPERARPLLSFLRRNAGPRERGGT